MSMSKRKHPPCCIGCTPAALHQALVTCSKHIVIELLLACWWRCKHGDAKRHRVFARLSWRKKAEGCVAHGTKATARQPSTTKGKKLRTEAFNHRVSKSTPCARAAAVGPSSREQEYFSSSIETGDCQRLLASRG